LGTHGTTKDLEGKEAPNTDRKKVERTREAKKQGGKEKAIKRT
jgi:hypothetical protein